MKAILVLTGTAAAIPFLSIPARADPIFTPLLLTTIFGSAAGTATIAGVSLATITTALITTSIGRGVRLLR